MKKLYLQKSRIVLRSLYLSLSLFLSIISSSLAQGFDLGSVAKKDFELYSSAEDTASAVVLKHYRETHFVYDGTSGWELITTVKKRIKILTPTGKTYATHKAKAYKRENSEERINKVSGYTYSLQNGIVKREKLDKSAIYEQEISEHWDAVSWTMPGVQTGAIIEWEYSLSSPFWKIDDLVMQEDIPVHHYEAVIRTPTMFSFNRFKKGYFEVAPETEFKERNDGVLVSGNGGYGTRTMHSTSARMRFTERVETYELEQIPALHPETYVKNIENYRFSIVYELESLTYGNGEVKKYTNTWEDVAQGIYEKEELGKQLEKINFLNADAENLKRKYSIRFELLKNAFAFIRDNFSWNGKYGKYVEDDLKEVYKRRSGNTAEINLNLVAMLQACGFEANPVLLGTKENGVPLYPTLEGFNYVIAGVRLDDKLYLMDATEKKSFLNILPERVYNWEGRMIQKNGKSTEVSLYPEKTTQQDYLVDYELGTQGKISGNVKRRYNGLSALDYRNKKGSKSLENRQKELINELKIDQITSLEIKDLEALDQPVIESYSFTIENAYDQVGDAIYLSPLLFTSISSSPFQLEKRQFPVDFSYPFTTTRSINLRVPKGYKIESLPQSVHLVLPGDMGSFKYNVSSHAGIINLRAIFALNQARLPVVYYDALKKFYEQRVTKEQEKIVFKKIEQ